MALSSWIQFRVQYFKVHSKGTSTIVDEVLSASANYTASFGDKARLAMLLARRFANLCCTDARLDPVKYAGLREGEACHSQCRW